MTRFKKRREKIIKLFYFLFGVFILSTIYNTILAPNNIVLGGVSGLAIVVRELTGMSTTIFIDIANVVLVIISFIFLGKKETMTQLLGCIVYPLMITITAPIANVVTINLESKLLLFAISAVIYGLGSGIVYRAGYSTGGFDILIQIFSNKFKKSITQISPILNYSVIFIGGIVFNPVQIMYALVIIFISNRVTNAVLFSVSTSKMVYVISNKNSEIEDYIMNKIHTGATELKIHSGFFQKKRQMLLCVIHNVQYKKFKDKILKMDPEAFILAKTCYQVSGGIRYELLPF